MHDGIDLLPRKRAPISIWMKTDAVGGVEARAKTDFRNCKMYTRCDETFDFTYGRASSILQVCFRRTCSTERLEPIGISESRSHSRLELRLADPAPPASFANCDNHGPAQSHHRLSGPAQHQHQHSLAHRYTRLFRFWKRGIERCALRLLRDTKNTMATTATMMPARQAAPAADSDHLSPCREWPSDHSLEWC